MKKTLFGIEKEDFRYAFIIENEICIDYVEHYDHNDYQTTTFTNQTMEENTKENRLKILDVFGFDVTTEQFQK